MMALYKEITSVTQSYCVLDLEVYKEFNNYITPPFVIFDERVDDSIFRVWKRESDGSVRFIKSIELCDPEEWVFGFLLQNDLIKTIYSVDENNEPHYYIGEKFSNELLEDDFFVEITKDILPLHEKIKASRESFLDLKNYIIESIQKRKYES